MEQNEEVQNPEAVKDPQAVLAELRRAQEDLKNLRAENKTLTDERDSLKAAVEEAGEDPFKGKAIEAETKLALQGLGFNDPDRLMRYVGKEGIDFDDKGGLTGLTERIDQLKSDLPELFDVKRAVGGKADIFANDSAEVNQDPFRAAVHQALSN